MQPGPLTENGALVIYCPLEQLKQSMDPSGEYFPLEHIPDTDESADTAQKVPAGQAVHEEEPALEL